MSGILIKITTTDYAADRFRWYEVFGHTSDIPDDNDVEGTASFAVISRDNYIPHVGLTPGSSWYHWVRGVYDDGSIKSDYAKFGPDVAPSNGSISASQITDASDDAVDLITAADFSAMRALLNSTRPQFFAYLSSVQSNVTGNGASYTVAFDTEDGDVGSNFASNTFTATIEGWHFFHTQVYLQGLASGNTAGDLALIASGSRHYFVADANLGAMRDANNELSLGGSAMVYLTNGQTVTVRLRVFNGASDTVDVYGSSLRATYFMGYLL